MAQPEEVNEEARSLLVETFGSPSHAVEGAFAHGVLGLMSEHTHYFRGFALLMPIEHGTAVAARVSNRPGCHCIVAGQAALQIEGSEPDPRYRLVGRLVRDVGPGDAGIEIAVVSTVPAWWREVGLTALGVAVVRALQTLFSLPSDEAVLMQSVRAAVEASLEMPFSIAYPLAANDAHPGTVVLVDTQEEERMTLPLADPEILGWGAIHADVDVSRFKATVEQHVRAADRALTTLKRRGFQHLTSYRELEHRDLERALQLLPQAQAPVVRYLVTENRRVQKLVVALRRRDWQMMGALMLMSHAVQRDDWALTSPEADYVVERVEGMSLEGLYGARMTGRSGTVLLVGQPFVLPAFLDRIQAELQQRSGTRPETLLL